MADTLPVTVNLDAYRGDTWAQDFRFLTDDVPEDLTGASVEAEARAANGDVVPLVCDLGDDPGVVTLRLPTPNPDPGSYSYDVEVTDGGVVTTWVRGRLVVARDVTNES